MRLIIGLVFCVIGAAIFAIPNMTRRGILFGLAIPTNFRESAGGRKSVAQFRALVVIALATDLSALFFAPETFLVPISVAGPLLTLLAGGIGFAWQRRRVAPFAVEPEHAREVDLTNAPDRLPWFIWLAPGPFAMLSAAAIVLSLNWGNIPGSFPVHWGLDGRPDRWHNRTVLGVCGILIFGVELCAWMLVMGLATWFGARRSRLRRVTLGALTAVEYMMGLMFAAMALQPLHVNVPLWVFVSPLLLIVPVVVAMARAVAGPGDAAEPTPNECWKAGIFYYNPSDPALFVEKRSGLGYTLNVGNRWSWVLPLGLLLVVGTAPLLL